MRRVRSMVQAEFVPTRVWSACESVPGNIVRDRTNRRTHHTRMAGSLSWTQHNTRGYDVRAGSLIQAQKPPNLSSCSRQHDNARQVHQTPCQARRPCARSGDKLVEPSGHTSATSQTRSACCSYVAGGEKPAAVPLTRRTAPHTAHHSLRVSCVHFSFYSLHS